MIKKLRRKVVLLTMTSLSVLLALVVTAMNVINYGFIVENADDVLTYVNQNDGRFPDKHKEKITPTDALVKPPVNKRINDETEYESRFFSVVLTEGGGVVLVDTGKIAAVNSDGAVAMAREALSGGRARGFSGIYRYAVMRCADGLVRVTFLDSRHGLENFRYFLNVSVGLTLTALAIALVVVFFLAGRFIRPIAESYEKQKRFITDAGHEIKTPLTVINANAELLECDFGENESIEDIKDQTKRLTALTEKLVYLARMEENDKSLPKETFSLTALAEEMIPAFAHLAQAQGKAFRADLRPEISFHGNEEMIGRLISLLLDNAVKYASPGGEITAALTKQGRHILFSVSNPTEGNVKKEDLGHLFERFYRADGSRNSETGGHGIGLSTAKAITEQHGGKIKADLTDGGLFTITVTLPG